MHAERLFSRAIFVLLLAKAAYGSNCPDTALHRSWMLAERAFGQAATVYSRSVRFAFPRYDNGCSTTSSKSFWSSTISVRTPPRVSHHRSGSKSE